MLAHILTENDLDVKKCVGNATDGAANMQGQFNGFSAGLEKLSPNEVYSNFEDLQKNKLPATALYELTE